MSKQANYQSQPAAAINFTFSFGVPETPFVEVGRSGETCTAVAPLHAVRHLLSDKPLVRPRRLGEPSDPVAWHTGRIATWAQMHALTAAEVERLTRVMTEYAAADLGDELAEELRCILAARTLAAKTPLTDEQVDRAGLAAESGLAGFIAQDVD